MIGDQRYHWMRKKEFDNWSNNIKIPGLARTTYIGVFDYIIQKQRSNGSWVMDDRPLWAIVQTAVILKSLALIGYSSESTWPISEGEKNHSGGVAKALDFLCEETKKYPGQIIGEDIWDTCQVMLALHSFRLGHICLEHVKKINNEWKDLYESAISPSKVNKWSGPAYLAAMVEVLSAYDDNLEQKNSLPDILAQIADLERKDAQGNGTGIFPAVIQNFDTTRWNTSLVLRLLCSLPLKYRDLVDAELIERIVKTQIQDLKKHVIGSTSFEEPMYISRCLDGLRAAMQRISGNLQPQIAQALKIGNDRLESIWKDADLKAHTAMAEYFAAIIVSVPAGLLFDIGSELSPVTEIPKDIVNGFQLVWLSDLHVSTENDEKPWAMRLLPRWLGGFKYVKGNVLAQSFPERNLDTILNRIVEIEPDHILITGDITNYAKPNQFQAAKYKFLKAQQLIPKSRISSIPDGELDPNLWTILPGNHDVTTEKYKNGKLRKNLGLFFEYFGELYGKSNNDFDHAFPKEQILSKSGSRKIHLISLDSNVDWPVWVVGYNARGYVDEAQMILLASILNAPRDPLEIVIVALHHHPIVVPEMVHDIEDYFLSLDEAIGRRLVALCNKSGVSVILHGHFHRLSKWTGSVGNSNQNFSIIGSPAGTVDVPNMSNEFLEWCEATIETETSIRQGLALYRHAQQNGVWAREYLNVFIG